MSNPRKVLFPQAGHTKLDLARYYIAVAEGALRGAGGRPNVLVRYPERRRRANSSSRSARRDRGRRWIEVVTLTFPSGRTAEEIVPRDAAALVWMANLACLELHPHPVRADDLDHPDELRDRSRSGARRRVAADPRRRRGRARHARRLRSRGLAEDVGLARDPRLRAHRAAMDVRRGAARRARVRARGRAARAGARDQQVVEGRAPRRLPRLQPEREGSHRRERLLGPADAPTRACRRRSRGTKSPRASPADFTLATMPARFARDRRPPRRHRRAARDRSRRCSSCRSGRSATASATRPGRRTTGSRRARRRVWRRPGGRDAGRTRSSRSAARATRPTRSPGSNDGRRATLTRRRTSSRRTCWSMRCGGGSARGHASRQPAARAGTAAATPGTARSRRRPRRRVARREASHQVVRIRAA